MWSHLKAAETVFRTICDAMPGPCFGYFLRSGGADGLRTMPFRHFGNGLLARWSCPAPPRRARIRSSGLQRTCSWLSHHRRALPSVQHGSPRPACRPGTHLLAFRFLRSDSLRCQESTSQGDTISTSRKATLPSTSLQCSSGINPRIWNRRPKITKAA